MVRHDVRASFVIIYCKLPEKRYEIKKDKMLM